MTTAPANGSSGLMTVTACLERIFRSMRHTQQHKQHVPKMLPKTMPTINPTGTSSLETIVKSTNKSCASGGAQPTGLSKDQPIGGQIRGGAKSNDKRERGGGARIIHLVGVKAIFHDVVPYELLARLPDHGAAVFGRPRVAAVGRLGIDAAARVPRGVPRAGDEGPCDSSQEDIAAGVTVAHL
eukprot:CAMPEP_0170335698 /NCGR_PEP_ID=MMETSP0116_2-20130129/68889_1 /TAXON_ID=400756 /ORGANISM="Durinskia baltica, Strain CSIRO CS-38" /LENGTH=182 /DNA_ID=CAMNT_0010589081 /DNA_START=145 /DNA_END=694 /DNA_ORIENTATION=+